MSKIISIVNQKGGTGKTTTTLNLGIGLAHAGKKVLLVDTDPQGSLTISLGYPQPDELKSTLSNIYEEEMRDQRISLDQVVLSQQEGIDLLPGNISLASIEISLVNAMSRECILKQYLDTLRDHYDFILLDCMPSLGMLTVNALAASDSVLIPVQANYLSVKGLEQLLKTISRIRVHINRNLFVEGILLTMVGARTNYAKEIGKLIRDTYGNVIHVFDCEIPRSTRAAETSAEGVSIFRYDPKGKVSTAYGSLAMEVLK